MPVTEVAGLCSNFQKVLKIGGLYSYQIREKRDLQKTLIKNLRKFSKTTKYLGDRDVSLQIEYATKMSKKSFSPFYELEKN